MKRKAIDKEIASLTEELTQYSGNDPRHAAILSEIERLEKLRNSIKPWWKLDSSTINTIITSICALGQLLLVISFEANGAFRSKALSWVTRPRG